MSRVKPPLSGKVALVTGAGRGLGREIGLALAGLGASLALADRAPEALDEVAALVSAKGAGEALLLPTDIGEPGQAHSLAEGVRQAFGGLDILVHAAGRGRPGGFLGADPDQVWSLIRTRIWGAWLVTRASLPLMAGRNGADVVFFAAAPGCEPAWSMRGVVLAGADALAEALRRELAAAERWAGIGVLTVRLDPPPAPATPEETSAGARPLPHVRRARGELAEAARRVALALTHPPEVAVRELVIRTG